MTTVYLIRHAYAQGNQDKSFQGRIDGKLTELGYRQLEGLAEACRGLKFDAVYSSPLSRAYETAQAANRYYGYEIQTDDGLMEIDGGDWEGKRWADLFVSDPERYEKWNRRDRDFSAPNGEKIETVYNRIRDTVLQIVKNNKNKTICIVSHGCAIENFMAWASGFSADEVKKVPICDNTAINCLTFDDNLLPAVVFQNDIGHLDDSLKTYVANLFTDSEETKKSRA